MPQASTPTPTITRGETAYRLRQTNLPWKDVAAEMGYPRADNAIQIAKKWCRSSNKRRVREGEDELSWPPFAQEGRGVVGEKCYNAKRFEPHRTWRAVGAQFGVPAAMANKAAAEYVRVENAQREASTKKKKPTPLPWPLVGVKHSGQRAFELRQRHPGWTWQKIGKCMGYPKSSKHSAWDVARGYFMRENDRREQGGEPLLLWPPEANGSPT